MTKFDGFDGFDGFEVPEVRKNIIFNEKNQNLNFFENFLKNFKILEFFRIMKTLNIFVYKWPKKVSLTSIHKKSAFCDKI